MWLLPQAPEGMIWKAKKQSEKNSKQQLILNVSLVVWMADDNND